MIISFYFNILLRFLIRLLFTLLIELLIELFIDYLLLYNLLYNIFIYPLLLLYNWLYNFGIEIYIDPYKQIMLIHYLAPFTLMLTRYYDVDWTNFNIENYIDWNYLNMRISELLNTDTSQNSNNSNNQNPRPPVNSDGLLHDQRNRSEDDEDKNKNPSAPAPGSSSTSMPGPSSASGREINVYVSKPIYVNGLRDWSLFAAPEYSIPGSIHIKDIADFLDMAKSQELEKRSLINATNKSVSLTDVDIKLHYSRNSDVSREKINMAKTLYKIMGDNDLLINKKYFGATVVSPEFLAKIRNIK